MTAATMMKSQSGPLVYFTVNGTGTGTPLVSMQPGETWYVMIRNWRNSNGANSCIDATCPTGFKAYFW